MQKKYLKIEQNIEFEHHLEHLSYPIVWYLIHYGPHTIFGKKWYNFFPNIEKNVNIYFIIWKKMVRYFSKFGKKC